MVTIRVIRPFIRKGQLVPKGATLEVPTDVLPKLSPLVEITDPPETPELIAKGGTSDDIMYCELLQTIRNLDMACDWTGFRQSLSQVQRKEIKALEARIESTYMQNDREGFRIALEKYSQACISMRRDLIGREALACG